MDYLLYEPEDFAANESYLGYFFRRNEADIAFWENWISNHPERLDVIINADQLISMLYLQVSKDEIDQELQRLTQTIQSGAASAAQLELPSMDIEEALETDDATNETYRIGRRSSFARISRWIVAASILLFAVAGVYYFSPLRQEENTAVADGYLHRRNTTSAAESFVLSDGTLVTLQPGSTLIHPKTFDGQKREVTLDGEAFFKVKKDHNRSFYVYHQQLVTHVLGTSFNVKVDKARKQVEVSVVTGRVEVYEKKHTRDAFNPKGNGVILTPNQRVIYSEENKRFDASIVDVPLPVPVESNDYTKRPAQITTGGENTFGGIIAAMEKLYGIEIEVEDDNIKKCHFSGDLSELNLYVRLDIICQALGASYENKGTKIIVRGKGCN